MGTGSVELMGGGSGGERLGCGDAGDRRARRNKSRNNLEKKPEAK